MTNAEVRELMKDAESCARLTQWEEEFCDTIRGNLLTRGEDLWLSDNQINVLRRIEEKVYA